MKNNIFKLTMLVLMIILGLNSCKKNFENPNAATSDKVLTAPKTLMGVAVGIQRTYSLSVAYGIADVTGLITGETFLRNAGNASELQLSAGGATVDNSNLLLQNIWTTSSKCIYDADNVITNAASLSDKGYASGLIGYATIIKALSIGVQSMYWENVPDAIGTTNSAFVPRSQGFAKAISAIDNALGAIATNPISAGFLADLPAGIDIVNTLQALKARYSLFAGNYPAAIAAANLVDLTKASVLNFDAAVPNPIFTSVTSTNNIYQPIDSTLGLPTPIQPALNDARVPFYTLLVPDPATPPRFRLNGFWNSTTRKIPIYFSNEVRLIKAECLLRQSSPDAPSAQAIIDAVLKQVPSADPNGVGANIAAGYTGANDVASLLTEVYRNRCIDMFLSGLKLEDMRRFGRPLTERKRNFFPYPINERNNNPNTPADPAF
jgi:starch-binding outer membrane protein, SusD/RagB family